MVKKDSVKHPCSLVKSNHDVIKPAGDFCKLIKKSWLPINKIITQQITNSNNWSWGIRISISRETAEWNIKVNISLWGTRQSIILLVDKSDWIPNMIDIISKLEELKDKITTPLKWERNKK